MVMDVLKRSRFDKLLDKATSDTLIDPDIETTLTICDLIRSQEISAKLAVQSVKKKLQHDNPVVVLQAIYVLEAMMKNCGAVVQDEVATADFMQSFSLLVTKSFDVRSKALACIHNWTYAFKGKPEYSAFQDVYTELKREGYSFPELSENDAMFNVACAPNWKEDTSCHRCKVAFTTFRRRHHCRNCGNSVCTDCSANRAVLPNFGIEKEVRVCDHCFEQLSRAHSLEKKVQSNPNEQGQRDKDRRDRELATQEAEELELALALSASEAESKERERRIPHPVNFTSVEKATDPGTSVSAASAAIPRNSEVNGRLQLLPVLDTTDMDPDLAHYLNRHYWENRAAMLATTTESSIAPGWVPSTRDASPQPSAPIYAAPNICSPVSELKTKITDQLVQSGTENKQTHYSDPTDVAELTSSKQEEFLTALRASIEFFVNRMQSDNQRGRSIAIDTTVQTLFLTLHQMHPQLLQYKQAMEDRRTYYESIEDKLTQLREAREALDALRQEQATNRLREEQEAARLRHLQMIQKLEMMRQQKRETLEYRRRMAFEQTMQYQHQYQPKPLSQPIDPTTGMPISTIAYPSAAPSMVPPQTTAYNLSAPYGHVTTPVYDQQNMESAPGYYTTGQYATVSQPHGLYGEQQNVFPPRFGQPTAAPVQSNPYAAQHSGPYHMQSLESALPSVTAYPQLGPNYSEPLGPAIRQQLHADLLPDPPTVPESNLITRPQQEPQPKPPSSTENQLISFD